MAAVRVGQILKGRHASYVIIDKMLKTDGTVFKAYTQSDRPVESPAASVVKCRPENKPGYVQYDREYKNYLAEPIRSSLYIRSHVDSIGHDEDGTAEPKCMIFEWMDTDLWQLNSEEFRSGSQLPRVVATSVLKALAVIHGIDGVHTDVNPNNVLVSGARTPNPVVKLADLGNAASWKKLKPQRAQGIEIRAPEHWKGLGTFPSADVWSLGVTLAHWLKSDAIFGAHDKIIDDYTNEWCIGKMIRLVGALGPLADAELNDEFAMGEALEQETFIRDEETGVPEKFIKVGTIREELEKVPGKKIDKACIDFIESLLIVDHTKRPTALEALQHPWLRD